MRVFRSKNRRYQFMRDTTFTHPDRPDIALHKYQGEQVHKLPEALADYLATEGAITTTIGKPYVESNEAFEVDLGRFTGKELSNDGAGNIHLRLFQRTGWNWVDKKGGYEGTVRLQPSAIHLVHKSAAKILTKLGLAEIHPWGNPFVYDARSKGDPVQLDRPVVIPPDTRPAGTTGSLLHSEYLDGDKRGTQSRAPISANA